MNNANLSHISAHYEVPNISSMLYEYTMKEHNVVTGAFRVGNYYSIRDLPNNINAFSVAEQLKQ